VSEMLLEASLTVRTRKY